MHSASSSRRRFFERGQSTLEATVVVVAVVTSAMLMARYVKESMRANAKMTEMQLNGAMGDNRP